MELKEGMYVRYIPTLGIYTQKISKITKVKNCLLDMAYYLDNSEEPVFSSHFDDIVGASENIIDLIEEGDYVNGKRVYNISIVDGLKYLDVEVEDYLSDMPFINADQIESIVTKEQFKAMKYTIEK